MNVKYLPPEALEAAVLELVENCRRRVADGNIDLSQMEQGVRSYCESLAALPLDEGRRHAKALERLMESITLLGNELVEARNALQNEIQSLNRVKNAHVAYKKTDGISGPSKIVRHEDDEL